MDNNSENETDAGIQKYLTRTDVAEQLDISIATVRRLEGKKLHPEKNERGVWIFDPGEVSEIAAIRATAKRYRRISKGEIAAIRSVRPRHYRPIGHRDIRREMGRK